MVKVHVWFTSILILFTLGLPTFRLKYQNRVVRTVTLLVGRIIKFCRVTHVSGNIKVFKCNTRMYVITKHTWIIDMGAFRCPKAWNGFQSSDCATSDTNGQLCLFFSGPKTICLTGFGLRTHLSRLQWRGVIQNCCSNTNTALFLFIFNFSYMRYRNITLGNQISCCCPDPILSNGTVPVWVWISWINGSITMGTGNVTGMNPMLFYPDNSLIANVSTVAVSSYGSATVVWKIPYNQSSGNRIKIIDRLHIWPVFGC